MTEPSAARSGLEVRVSAENDRGDLLGNLSDGRRVFDLPKAKSHLNRHPEITANLQDAFDQIKWNEDEKEGKSVVFDVELKDVDLGKAQVITVPDKPGVRIIYAPRLDQNGRPMQQPGQQAGELLYSRCVVGVPEEEVPDCHYLRVILSRPTNQTEDSYWLRLATAYSHAGENAAREAGIKFTVRAATDKNPALRFWEGIDEEGWRLDGGHAFVWDPTKFDTSNILSECPYDLQPYREPSTQ